MAESGDLTSTCPSCGEHVLPETQQCRRCGYRFDSGAVEEITYPILPSEAGSTTAEAECPSCRVHVRDGLVRCWNCGAFMRPEMAARHEEMKRKAPKVAFRPLPELEGTSPADEPVQSEVPEDEDATYRISGAAPQSPPVEDEQDEDDFDVSPELQTRVEKSPESDTPQVPTGEPVELDSAGSEGGESDENAGPRAPRKADESEVPHSEATGGDALMELAAEEEREHDRRATSREAQKKRRRPARKKPGKQAGKGSPERTAPAKGAASRKRKAGRPKESTPAVKSDERTVGGYQRWTRNLRLHVTPRKKTKAKAGALAKEFQPVDVAFAEEGLLVCSLQKKRKPFQKPPAPDAVRQEVVAHLKQDGSLAELPAEHWFFDREAVKSLEFEQPNEYVHETAFGGVPVFGEGRIVVKLPDTSDDSPHRFLSFSLSEFREFARDVDAAFGVKDLGAERGVPLQDAFDELQCHYTDQSLKVVRQAHFYEADPAFDLQVAGYRCQHCNLVISEDGRKKERIGGKQPKSLAKVKCPKCNKPFGEARLFELAGKKQAQPTEQPA